MAGSVHARPTLEGQATEILTIILNLLYDPTCDVDPKGHHHCLHRRDLLSFMGQCRRFHAIGEPLLYAKFIQTRYQSLSRFLRLLQPRAKLREHIKYVQLNELEGWPRELDINPADLHDAYHRLVIPEDSILCDQKWWILAIYLLSLLSNTEELEITIHSKRLTQRPSYFEYIFFGASRFSHPKMRGFLPKLHKALFSLDGLLYCPVLRVPLLIMQHETLEVSQSILSLCST